MIENPNDRLSLENPLSDSIEEQVARRHPSMFSQQRRKLTNGKEGEKKKKKEEDSTRDTLSPSIMEASSAFHSEFEWRRLPLTATERASTVLTSAISFYLYVHNDNTKAGTEPLIVDRQTRTRYRFSI